MGMGNGAFCVLNFILLPYAGLLSCIPFIRSEVVVSQLFHLSDVARQLFYYDYDIIASATQCRDQIPQFEYVDMPK